MVSQHLDTNLASKDLKAWNEALRARIG